MDAVLDDRYDPREIAAGPPIAFRKPNGHQIAVRGDGGCRTDLLARDDDGTADGEKEYVRPESSKVRHQRGHGIQLSRFGIALDEVDLLTLGPAVNVLGPATVAGASTPAALGLTVASFAGDAATTPSVR